MLVASREEQDYPGACGDLTLYPKEPFPSSLAEGTSGYLLWLLAHQRAGWSPASLSTEPVTHFRGHASILALLNPLLSKLSPAHGSPSPQSPILLITLLFLPVSLCLSREYTSGA